MLPHWTPLLMLLLIGAFVGIAGLIVIRRARFQRIEQARIPCPVHGQTYDVSVLKDARTGAKLSVLGCAAWHDWRKAGCDARCLRSVAIEERRST